MKEGFYQLELNKTIWEVAERYTNLAPVGSGAYGQVNINRILAKIQLLTIVNFLFCILKSPRSYLFSCSCIRA